jgi:GTP-binding protein
MSASAPAPTPIDVLDAVFLATAVKSDGLPPPEFAEIAFAGRSNVGKSSVINTLVQRRKLVRTSSTPGATRGLNLFRATLRDGAQLDLVDLPGYGYAKVSKSERNAWGPLIEGFLRRRKGVRAVVVIVDARRGLEPDDAQLLAFLQHLELKAIVVATKLDKLPANKQKPAIAAVARDSGVRAFGFSSEDGTGREELWRVLVRAAGLGGVTEATSAPPAPAQRVEPEPAPGVRVATAPIGTARGSAPAVTTGAPTAGSAAPGKPRSSRGNPGAPRRRSAGK